MIGYTRTLRAGRYKTGWNALLNGKLTLWDVDDAEAFCWRIVHRSRLGLNQLDEEELVAYPITTCWELSIRYAPGEKQVTAKVFSTWAGNILPLRVTDWKRKKYGRSKWAWTGRSYERPRPIILSLDVDGIERDRLDAGLQRLITALPR